MNITKRAAEILLGYVDEASERAQTEEDYENLTIAWKALGVEVTDEEAIDPRLDNAGLPAGAGA